MKNQSEIERLKGAVYPTLVPILLTLCAASVIANIYIFLVVLLRRKGTKIHQSHASPALTYTISLVAADAWLGVLFAAALTANSFLPQMITFDPKNTFCFILTIEALRLGAVLSTVLHLLALSITHYIATVHALFHRQVADRLGWVTAVTLIFSWIVPPTSYLLAFTTMSDQAYRSENCLRNEWIKSAALRWTTFWFVFGPLLAMAAMYVEIIRVLCRMKNELSSNERTKSLPSEVEMTECQPTNCFFKQPPRKQFVQRRTKTTITAILIVSTFVVGWLPSATLFLVTCDSCVLPTTYLEVEYPQLFVWTSIVCNALMLCKPLVNPLIYAMRIPEIKDAMRAMHAKPLALLFPPKQRRPPPVVVELETVAMRQASPEDVDHLKGERKAEQVPSFPVEPCLRNSSILIADVRLHFAADV